MRRLSSNLLIRILDGSDANTDQGNKRTHRRLANANKSSDQAQFEKCTRGQYNASCHRGSYNRRSRTHGAIDLAPKVLSGLEFASRLGLPCWTVEATRAGAEPAASRTARSRRG